MTILGAIEEIKNLQIPFYQEGARTKVIETIKMEFEQLETKQAPKAPLKKMGGDLCPTCYKILYKDKYCSGCGQAINWEDNYEK